MARTSARRGPSRPDLSLVIPCYNEESSIAQMISNLQPVVSSLADKRSVEVVLVDDGSSDGTWDRMNALAAARGLEAAQLVLLRHERNRGLGAALRTGLRGAHGKIVVTTDSDSTYRFTEIPRLLSFMTPSVDIVTASPYHPLGAVEGVPKYRLILSRGSSLIYRVLVDSRVHTFTSLFRAYRADVIKDVSFSSDGYLAVAEILVNAILSGYRVAEYPATLHSRAIGTSKAKVVRIIRAHLRFQALVLLRRLRIGRKIVRKRIPPTLSISQG